MKHLIWTMSLAGVVSLAVVPPAFSHHSHAMFDLSKELTVTGTVTQFVFRNPHVFLYLDVKSANGEVVNYSVEMSNLPNMIRRGIGQGTFKVGEQITVNMHPLRDGRPGGSYATIVDASGKKYE